ncbi:uncharacterized protein KY384_001317 [Bacidia gigantensis]|uniref:uncharacterized protein n=1 Tax=Bacidia gigantensis TaxID=2732470 RepID=UPI001D049B3B|nr:uncharacterized protein KY384_001317 [Bacidia gigantensis]KAG8533577.1 hypothetical protein KY384_001317 [Bacidia gigantensis]
MSTPDLPAYKADFLSACLRGSVIQFGSYTLKSGRTGSPFFFNAGLFLTNASLFHSIQTAYAQTLLQSTVSHPDFGFDVLFGPAYKAIPLAAATFSELARLDGAKFGHVGCAFNRKEVKVHGDGGSLVGAKLEGKRVVVLDDVLTVGTAVRESVDIIKAQGGTLAGIVIALDRMEKLPSTKEGEEAPNISAIAQMRRDFQVPVLSIISVLDLVEVLRASGSEGDLQRIIEYRKLWGTEE